MFAVLVLIGVGLRALHPQGACGRERFEGSHLGEADLILALIATIAITLLLWHATRIALGLNEWPASSAPVSNLLSHLFADDGVTRVLERVFVWAHVLTILGFLAYLPRSKHLHIASAAFNVWYGRTGPGGRLEPLRFDDPDIPEEDIRFGAGTAADLTWKQMLDTYLVHRVRALPGRLPGVRHRQGAVAQAADHGAARPGVRRRRGDRPGARGKRWRSGRSGRPDRSDLSRSQRRARGVGVGLRDLRRLRPGLPGLDRARRPHRRPAPPPGDGGVELPGRGRADAARRRAGVEPVGQGAVRARRLGRRRSGCGSSSPATPRPEYLYWVGCASSFDERARTTAESTVKLLQRAGVDFAILGAARGVHRRPGPADRQRVRLPGVRRAERGDAQRGRGDEDHRQLPALLQHAGQRVPATSAATTR